MVKPFRHEPVHTPCILPFVLRVHSHCIHWHLGSFHSHSIHWHFGSFHSLLRLSIWHSSAKNYLFLNKIVLFSLFVCFYNTLRYGKEQGIIWKQDLSYERSIDGDTLSLSHRSFTFYPCYYAETVGWHPGWQEFSWLTLARWEKGPCSSGPTKLFA